MVDFSKVSQSLAGRIAKIMDGDGNDSKKIDSRNEYNQLAELLSGKGKVSGDEKTFVKEMMSDYIEEFEVRSEIKKAVLDYIKNGNALQADNNTEIKDLKAFLKTDGLTKQEKQWIKEIINGRIVKTTVPEQNELSDEPNVPDPNNGTKTEEPKAPVNSVGGDKVPPNDKKPENPEPEPQEPIEDWFARLLPPKDKKPRGPFDDVEFTIRPPSDKKPENPEPKPPGWDIDPGFYIPPEPKPPLLDPRFYKTE